MQNTHTHIHTRARWHKTTTWCLLKATFFSNFQNNKRHLLRKKHNGVVKWWL